MKKYIIALLAILPLAAYAQKYEIGGAIGLSINGKPTNNMPYRGEVVTANYATDFTLLRNYDNNWQFGLDVHVLELSRKTNDARYPALYTTSTEEGGSTSKGKKFIYGKITPSFCFTINKKFPRKKGYYYLGWEMGLGIERNSDSKHPTGDVFYIAPDGGYGLAYGPHGGYSRKVSKKLSVNAQLSVLVYDIDYKAGSPINKPLTNIHYRMWATPLTVGIRYGFGNMTKTEKKIKHQKDVKPLK